MYTIKTHFILVGLPLEGDPQFPKSSLPLKVKFDWPSCHQEVLPQNNLLSYRLLLFLPYFKCYESFLWNSKQKRYLREVRKKVDPVLKAHIFLLILGLLRPTIYQIHNHSIHHSIHQSFNSSLIQFITIIKNP